MGEVKFNFNPNTIYCGDNLKVLADFPDECVDLIYIDPPFFSQRNYEVLWNDGFELRCFEDRWEGGIQHYIGWMLPRIEQLYRVLKKTGSFYLHCDMNANAYLKVMCDTIFGYKNLRSEIIWRIGWVSGYKTQKKGWIRNHDTLYYYVKTNRKDNYIFNKEYIPYPKDYVRRDGKLPTGKGFPMEDTWNCHEGDPLHSIMIMSFSKEKLGYPTQKPEVLLKRIIKASSNKGDIVLDSFCGCGTTIAVAKKLGRKWIGIDVSPTACRLMAKRISSAKSKIVGMKYDLKELKALPHFEFQNWAVERLGGKISEKLSNDFGIDGIIPVHHRGANLPIEVKQHNVSRPDIDKFETAMKRVKKKIGFFVGLGKTESSTFSKGAIEEIARAKNEEKLEIIPITTRSLLKKDDEEKV